MYCEIYKQKYLGKITEMYSYHFHMDDSFTCKFKNHEQIFFGYLIKCREMINLIIENEEKKSNITKLNSFLKNWSKIEEDKLLGYSIRSFLRIMEKDLLGEETFKEINKIHPNRFFEIYKVDYFGAILNKYCDLIGYESFNSKFGIINNKNFLNYLKKCFNNIIIPFKFPVNQKNCSKLNHEQIFLEYLKRCLAMVTSIIENEEENPNTTKLNSFLKNWSKIEEGELVDYSIRVFLYIMEKDLLGEETLKEIKKINPNSFFKIYKVDYIEAISNKYCDLVSYESFNSKFGIINNQNFLNYLEKCFNIIITLQFSGNQKIYLNSNL